MEIVLCTTVHDYNVMYNVRDKVAYNPEKGITYNRVPEFKKLYVGHQDKKFMIVNNLKGRAIYKEVDDVNECLDHILKSLLKALKSKL